MPRKPAPIRPYRDSVARRGRGLPAQFLNVGPKSAAWLADAGIHSLDDVRRLGPVESCRRMRARGHEVSVVMAYALEGALAGCHWNAIPAETREVLRVEFLRMKRGASGCV